MPADGPEKSALDYICCCHPSVDSALYPERHRNRTDMTTLSHKIHDCPMPLADLDVLFPKGHQFCAPESTSEQDRDHGHVTGASEAFPIRFLKEHASLIAGEPVSGARAQLLHAFDSPDAGCQFWTQ
jgi:hypothetical protein